jgi:CMP/dCMP kinase
VKKITIAIDGPAASGKSTVGAALAHRLGFLYFDTGVMYRAVTWAALQRGIPIADEAAIAALAEALHIEVTLPTIADGRQYDVYADGHDITWQIREPQVNACVSPVSTYRRVRQVLTREQRRIGSAGAVVMVGRDIGSVVLPEAEVKVYLDASLEERARRRHQENLQRGLPSDYAAVLENLRQRDTIDSSRQEAPLCVPQDAVVIDSTHLTVAEVIQRIATMIDAVLGVQDAQG